MKVLIVDDEPTVRLLLTRILRREVGCEVNEATNGLEALELLSRQRYDFVVLDVMMPLMDGVETLEAIRNSEATRSLPVMMLTAVRDEAQVRRIVSLGISAYLTKPLRPADAGERIARFVATLGDSTHTPSTVGGRSLAGVVDNSRLLVVDGDSNVRHFLKSTLEPRFVIEEAEGGAQGLRSVLNAPPTAILLGQNLGAVSAAMFVRKLRGLPVGADIPVVLASAGTDARPDDVDGVIQRTFVPDTFRRQFDQLIKGGGPSQPLLAARPQIRPEMISATEQVFGMMLGLEVLADPAEPSVPAPGNDLAHVTLKVASQEWDIDVGIFSSRQMSERMTSRFLQGADVVTDEDIYGTLQELSNIIAGRLQNALRGQGDEVAIGLPVTATVDESMSFGDGWVAVSFQDSARELLFTTFARAVQRDADAPAQTAVA